MSEHKEVRAKTGEDRDGKAFYKTIGRVLETKKGPMLKLDVIPLGWDGWAYLSDPKPQEGRPQSGGARGEHQRKSNDFDEPPF